MALEVFLVGFSLKNTMNLSTSAHAWAHAFRTSAQLSPRDLANETDALQREQRRHRKHKWKPKGVRRPLRGANLAGGGEEGDERRRG